MLTHTEIIRKHTSNWPYC